MGHGIKLTIFPVTDLDKAKATYTALIGVDPYVDAAYYVGYRVDNQEIGLDPHGHNKGMTGPLNYWEVDDVEGSNQDCSSTRARNSTKPRTMLAAAN